MPMLGKVRTRSLTGVRRSRGLAAMSYVTQLVDSTGPIQAMRAIARYRFDIVQRPS